MAFKRTSSNQSLMSLLRKASPSMTSVQAAPSLLPNMNPRARNTHYSMNETKTIPSNTNTKLNQSSNPAENRIQSKASNLRRRHIINNQNDAFHYSSPRLSAVRNSSMNKRSAIGPPHPDDHGKMTVVLDVDETLIHSRLTSSQSRFRQTEERKDNAGSCEEFKIVLEDGETVWVNKRPGLDGFLLEVSQRYEIVAYTAGLEEYAKPLLDWLDPRGVIFRHRLYRDSCLFIRGYYVKDLQKLNRSLNRTVLVDNNAFCFLPQLSNGIPISSFYDDPTDNALHVLNTFLKRLENENDVRPILNKSFNLQNLLKEHREHIIG
mmetsp:Transcript_4271/g.5375  ORF Transcript_4271/g.5375 Transcript_4271/m.5375 type:complete len:320 (+) Transcript_4271:230-1189(+)